MNVRIIRHDQPERTTMYTSVAEVILHDEVITLIYEDDADGDEFQLAEIFDLRIDMDGAVT
jgi:hypothetical protein